jgi:hypothetical protein
VSRSDATPYDGPACRWCGRDVETDDTLCAECAERRLAAVESELAALRSSLATGGDLVGLRQIAAALGRAEGTLAKWRSDPALRARYRVDRYVKQSGRLLTTSRRDLAEWRRWLAAVGAQCSTARGNGR